MTRCLSLRPAPQGWTPLRWSALRWVALRWVPVRPVLLWTAMAFSLVGCANKSLEHREAERIVAAIERLGTVPAAEREHLIVALETAKIESPRVDKLRIECAAAYRALHNAQVGLARSAQSDPFKAVETLKTVNDAIEEAKAAHDRCKRALADVRTALGAT